MNELILINNEQEAGGAGRAISQHIDLLGGRPDLQPEDLAQLLSRARAAGAEIEHDPRVKMLFARFLADFEQRKDQFAASTWDQLQYGWRKFSRWCEENQLNPLPASSQIVEQYLQYIAANMHRNSIGSLLWAVRTIHVKAGCNDPTAAMVVRDKLKGVRRKKIEGGETIKQATALRQGDLETLHRCWADADTARHRRDLMAIHLAYETMLRKSELARVRIQDIELMDDGSGVVTIPWTKTNRSGEDEVAPITEQVVGMIDEYLQHNDLDWRSEGYLIRPLTRYGKLQRNISTPLSAPALDAIFRSAWETVLPHRPALRQQPPFSGHSCRVGAAQDLLAAGYSIPGIMQSGRWSSEAMVIRYCRKIMAQEGAMFQMRRGRHQD